MYSYVWASVRVRVGTSACPLHSLWVCAHRHRRGEEVTPRPPSKPSPVCSPAFVFMCFCCPVNAPLGPWAEMLNRSFEYELLVVSALSLLWLLLAIVKETRSTLTFEGAISLPGTLLTFQWYLTISALIIPGCNLRGKGD